MMELSTDAGLKTSVYTAEPGSKLEEAPDLLASRTATLADADSASVTDGA